MATRGVFIGMACLAAALVFGAGEVGAQDLTNWIRPYGFYTPNLNAGQYALQAGVSLTGNSSERESGEESWTSSYESSGSQYALNSNFLYAISDRWIVTSNLSFTPGQSGSESTSATTMPYGTSTHSQFNLKASYRAGVTMTYKPTPMFELFSVASYSRSRSVLDAPSAVEFNDQVSKGYSLFVGFNTAR